MAWIAGWSHRKTVTITGQSGAGTDYQVNLSIGDASGGDFHLENHCTSFPNDIQVTDNDQTTPLDYWVEDLTIDPITMWVEVADDLGSNADVCVYYGKSGESSASNFDTTFICGDPLDNATLDTNRWTSVDGNPTYSIDATNHYLEVTDMDANNWHNGKGFHSKTISLPSEWIIEDAYSSDGFGMYHFSSINGDIYASYFSLHHTDFSAADWGIGVIKIGDYSSVNKQIAFEAGVGGNLDYNSGFMSPALPVTYDIKLWKLSGNVHITQDDVERVNEANAETPDRIHLGIGRHLANSFGTKRFYAFKVRKYNTPEPAFSSAGSEESEVLLGASNFAKLMAGGLI